MAPSNKEIQIMIIVISLLIVAQMRAIVCQNEVGVSQAHPVTDFIERMWRIDYFKNLFFKRGFH